MDSKVNKGVVLIDKPKGMTSFNVVKRVCEILGVKKAGHTGTLDPNVTGLMLIALNESRKAMPVLMGMDKEYEGEIYLHREVDPEKIKETFKKFTGEITQIPPVKSRVARIPRKRRIYSLEISKIEGRKISFKVKCEAGTYIRKLVHDIGESLGCGAHMTELRRTRIGNFALNEAVKLEDLDENRIIKLEKILERTGLKKVFVKDFAIERIRNGAPIKPDWIENGDKHIGENEMIGIFFRKEIIALGKPLGRKIRIDRVFKNCKWDTNTKH
jgi:H/ACA ribonucleoprotein complex subunit 4